MKELNVMNIDEPTIKLDIIELVSIFKNILMDSLNIDLDLLEVTIIAKNINNRLNIVLDTELLREKSLASYLCLIEDIKKVFGPDIFSLQPSINVNTLINKIFSGYDYYRINKDMSLEIYY